MAIMTIMIIMMTMKIWAFNDVKKFANRMILI